MTDPAVPAASTPPASTLLTFLLADIRGYTRFAAEHGDHAASQLSERFLLLCREVIEAQGGAVFGSAGDQTLAAFPSAHAALRAALALQTRLSQEQETHPDLPILAGIGLDTGEGVRTGSDYRSNAINLAARLCSIAGPGEIFASETVLTVAHVIEGMVLMDRGEVTLKGLDHPVRVMQIFPDGVVPGELTPLQPILVTHPTNLPDEPTPFIGRSGEVTQLTFLLRTPGVRLVTLTGPGGTGKSRLALQVGATLLYDFRGGVFFVSLAPLSDPILVPAAIAGVLGVKDEAGKSLLESLTDHLRDQHLLLVLDNFEHLLAAAAMVGSLLDTCRELHVLVTSRIPLHLAREHEHAVPPLSIPDPTHLPDLATLSQYESVALFIDRARAAKDSFLVTNENAPAVAELCSRLDGLPLAIELAAARIKLFPPRALLQRIDNRLQLLTGGARDRPSRQQTLRNTIDWSYSLLREEEQTLFARLSVFMGGCSVEAAEAVCNPTEDLDLLEALASLVDQSLLRQMGDQEPRFGMLETIREYAGEKLIEQGEQEAIRAAHAGYFLQLAEEAEPELKGPKQAAWFSRLEGDLDNLRVGLQYFLDTGVMEELRLAAALTYFWIYRGYWTEGQRWLEEGLARSDDGVSAARAQALSVLGFLDYLLGDGERAQPLLEQAVEQFQELGDRRGIAQALNGLSGVATDQGLFERSTALAEESLRLWRELGDHRYQAIMLTNLGMDAFARGDLARARERSEEALAIFREMGDTIGVTFPLQNLGDVALKQGNLTQAEALLEESLTQYRELGDKLRISQVLNSLAEVARKRGQLERARERLRESLLLVRELGSRRQAVNLLHSMAALSVVEGRAVQATQVKGAEMSLRERLSLPHFPIQRAENEETLAQLRAMLSEEEFGRAWERGRAMSLEGAIAFALEQTE